jgi:hypothetical protein
MNEPRVAECSRIVKIDQDQQLVFGWANVIEDENGQTILDRQSDFIDSADELEKSAYDYVLHCRDGGEMHVRKGVATMVESMVFTKEKQDALGVPPGTMPVGWWLGFKVNDSDVWAEVKKGGYIGFSVHGKGRREKVDLDLDSFSHEMPVRKTAGESWPASAFAHVPSLEKPNTWRLRIWESVEKKLTPRAVNRAVMLYSRDTDKYSELTRARLEKAFRTVEPDAELPTVLQPPDAMSDLDRKRILVKARTAVALSKHAIWED